MIQVHEAGWTSDELRATFDPRFLEVIEGRTRAAVDAAAAIITPSRSSADQITALYGTSPDRVHVVPHGVDHSVFHPDVDGGHALVHAAGGDREAPYVLYASSLHPRKNLSSLRAAMDELCVAGHPHRLVIVAAVAPDRSDNDGLIRSAVSPLPRSGAPVVRVVDPDDHQMAALMGGATVFCLPSLMEGFGMTVLEAMACRIPVVVSDRGALPEVIGGAGVLAEPDPKALANAIGALLDDEPRRQRLAEAAHRRALEFGWDATADGWHDVLRTVGADGPTSAT